VEVVKGARALDLYAGSGALGLEALSRGAASVDFVEANRRRCIQIGEALTALGLSEFGSVHNGRVERILETLEGEYGLAFADPPYIFDRWRDLLDDVMAAVLVCESDREIAPGIHTGWQTHRVRRYGTPVITILTRRAADGG